MIYQIQFYVGNEFRVDNYIAGLTELDLWPISLPNGYEMPDWVLDKIELETSPAEWAVPKPPDDLLDWYSVPMGLRASFEGRYVLNKLTLVDEIDRKEVT